ncbi:hypothetical protein [Paucibacter soli]|uniref:hypothetical protein n=1 Tax=Paucibacter soli TaxID=3133433 RepID=UPI0030B55C0A
MHKRTSASAGDSNTVMAEGFLAAWAKRARERCGGFPVFTLDDSPVADGEVGSPTSLLPVLAWHADNLYRFAVKDSGIGLEFFEDDEALLLRSVSLDRVQRSGSELMCFLLEAAEDARQHLPRSEKHPGAVELRGLVSQFCASMGVAHKSVETAANSMKLQG